jgi:protein-S-isoprenylcysteine O-methyltransferase Ste14
LLNRPSFRLHPCGLADNVSCVKLKALVGAGDRIIAFTLPFAAVGVVANALRPSWFRMGSENVGLVVGVVVLALGALVWAVSAVLLLVYASKGRLITRGPFAVVLHPLYTSVALLVLPGLGLLLDTWLGFALGAVLYLGSRLFSPAEEKQLAVAFSKEYPAYRSRVLLPWL